MAISRNRQQSECNLLMSNSNTHTHTSMIEVFLACFFTRSCFSFLVVEYKWVIDTCAHTGNNTELMSVCRRVCDHNSAKYRHRIDLMWKCGRDQWRLSSLLYQSVCLSYPTSTSCQRLGAPNTAIQRWSTHKRTQTHTHRTYESNLIEWFHARRHPVLTKRQFPFDCYTPNGSHNIQTK